MPSTGTPKLAGIAPTDARALMRMAWAIDKFRAVHPGGTLRQASAFLVVATNPGHGPTAYAKALGTIQPIASRWLLDLAHSGRDDKAGLGLLNRTVDTENLRHVRYTLTASGEKLARQMSAAILGQTPIR
jgi:DNA-binding MarR family transcriptional regulator